MKDFLLIFYFIATGFLGAFLYEFVAKKIGEIIFKKKAIIVCGYKLHHSLYGLFGLLVFVFLFLNGHNTLSKILLGLSIGIIIQHTLTDGFRFLSKEHTRH